MIETRKMIYATIVGGLVILTVMTVSRSGQRTGTFDPDQDRVRVVTGPSPAENPTMYLPQLPPAVPALPPADPAQAIEAAMIQEFPMLRDIRIECDPDCTLIAALGPNAATGDWPRSQWPYDGNLERFLGVRGYTPRGPLELDQPGDNDTLLRVPVRLPAGAGG